MSSVRRRLDRADGFTLVEVLVAITLLGLVAAATLPLLLIGARASTVVRNETKAKNLAQQQVERMRQLAFQVDRQNGPYVDLLDNYYPGRTAPAIAGGPGWISETSTDRLSGEPAGAFYRTVLTPETGFTQRIASQFLQQDRVAVPASLFTTYNSQTAGFDAAPSLFLGVTVVTSWTSGGTPKSFQVFTQIADTGRQVSLIASQARATAIRIQSAAPDGTSVSASVAAVNADGRLSDKSSAGVRAEAGRADRTGLAPLLAAYKEALSPTTAGGGNPTSGPVASASGCDFTGFGHSSVSGVTAATTDGLPQTPSTVGPAAAPAAMTSAALQANSGGTCGIFSFGNRSTSYDSNLRLVSGRPLVWVADTLNGNEDVVSARGWINAQPVTASPTFVAAGAEASMTTGVHLMPADFVTDEGGVVSVRLVSSSLTCNSTLASPAAAYRVIISYWNGTARQTLVDRTWSSASPTADPLAGLDLTAYPVTTGAGALTLANYIGSWSFGTEVGESNNGVAALDAAIRVTTVPVRGSADPTSSVVLRLGSLSCVADDNR